MSKFRQFISEMQTEDAKFEAELVEAIEAIEEAYAIRKAKKWITGKSRVKAAINKHTTASMQHSQNAASSADKAVFHRKEMRKIKTSSGDEDRTNPKWRSHQQDYSHHSQAARASNTSSINSAAKAGTIKQFAKSKGVKT